MSIIPNNSLESADSLILQTFGVKLDIDSADQQIDTYSIHSAFWKSCIIRNKQPIDKLQYRVQPNDVLKDVQPNSELPIKGWGSFLQVTSGATTPLGLVEFECVNYKEAMRKK